MLKRLVVYFIVSIPLAILLKMVIQHKYLWIFWTYMGVMGVTAFIAEWYDGEENKSKTVIWIEHVAFISVFTLFNWFAGMYFFT